jgi:hypothetical protein
MPVPDGLTGCWAALFPFFILHFSSCLSQPMSFTQRDATIAKRYRPRWASPVPSPFFIFHSSFFIMPFPDGSIGRYSLFLPWRTLRPLRENIILQSTHCKQRGATFFFLLQGILF